MSKNYFYPFILFYSLALLYLAWTTPISPHEAKVFYEESGIVHILMHSGYELIGGFIGIRFYFLTIGLITIFLYYRVTWIYLDRESDRYLATTIYVLLPGMITALVLANISVLVIPLVLLFLLSYDKKLIGLQAVLMLGLFLIHDAAIIFFMALFIYALINKERALSIISGVFILLSILVDQGVEIGGRPSGHFIDIFGLYAALFSPLLFIYFFYTLYRILLREEKNILWYISFAALVASLILSIRQKISLTDFAPYVIISVVLMLDSYNRTVRVRLPAYRKKYKFGFTIVVATLILVSSSIILHKLLFIFVDDPKIHFASRLYQPYWLAQELRSKSINCYDTEKRDTAYQLKFYNIEKCTE